jgi:hypothetical protein
MDAAELEELAESLSRVFGGSDTIVFGRLLSELTAEGG